MTLGRTGVGIGSVIPARRRLTPWGNHELKDRITPSSNKHKTGVTMVREGRCVKDMYVKEL